MITKKTWNNFLALRAKLGGIESQIEAHITECLETICEVYGEKLSTWYYPGAAEGQMGVMRMDSESISIQTVASGPIWEHTDHTDEFPLSFLFMSVKDVKKFVESEKKEVENAEAEKNRKAKEKQEARNKKKNAFKKSAAAKLTAAEKKALGL